MENTLTATSVVELRKSKSKKILSTLLWSFGAAVLLLFFTLVRLPEVRIKNLIQGQLSNFLADKGITLAVGSSSLSVGFGITYTMKDLVLNFPPPISPGKIDKVVLSPSFLKLLIGKFSANVEIETGDGELDSQISIAPSVLQTGSGSFNFSIEANNLNLARMGVLPLVANIQGGTILSGTAELEGDLGQSATWNGAANLSLKKFIFEPQTIAGFALPRISISESAFKVDVSSGKVKLTDVKFGKPGSSAEDLYGTLTGDITLTRGFINSPLNVQAKFGLSQAVLKSMVLLEALLMNAKQQDGSFAYTLTGTTDSPLASPLKL